MRIDGNGSWYSGLMAQNMETRVAPDEGASAPANAASQGAPQSPSRPTDEHVSVHSRPQAEDTGEPSLFAQIEDMGFVKYVEQMQAEKREKMREEILAAMGLSEEMLSEMSGEQRAAIEKLVEDEIQRRLAGTAALNASDEEETVAKPGGVDGLVLPLGNLALGPAGTKGRAIDDLGRGMGLGPLLALQEIAIEDGENTSDGAAHVPGKKDPEV